MGQVCNKSPASTATRTDRATSTAVYVKRFWGDHWQLARRLTPPSQADLRRRSQDAGAAQGEVPLINATLRARSCEWVAWPTIGTATFKYHFAEKARPEDFDLAGVDPEVPSTRSEIIRPIDLVGWFGAIAELVDGSRAPYTNGRLHTNPSGESEQIVWVGTFTEHLFGVTAKNAQAQAQKADATGEITVVAHDLRYLLTRAFVTGAWYEQLVGGSTYAVEADRMPPLNRVYRSNRAGAGNRSEDRDAFSRTYLFGRGERWSVYDFLEYALYHHRLDAALTGEILEAAGRDAAFRVSPAFKLGGPAAEDLRYLEAAGNFEGRSLFSVVDALVPRNKGFGIVPVTDGAPDSPVELRIFSHLDQTVTGPAGEQLTGNPSRIEIQLDENETLDEVLVRESALAQYDAIKVLGAPMTVTATFAYVDDSAAAGWTEVLATDYLIATDGEGDDDPDRELAEADDEYRKADRFGGVFADFVVPDAWYADPQNGNGRLGEETKTLRPFLPRLSDYGGLQYAADFKTVVARAIADPRYRFQRETRLIGGIDYGTHELLDSSPEDVGQNYVPLFAWIGAIKTGTFLYYPVTLIPPTLTGDDAAVGADVQVLDAAFGIRVRFRQAPPHIVAAGEIADFNEGGGDPFSTQKECYALGPLRWQRIGWTGTVETEARLRVIRRISPPHKLSLERIKPIYVPHARFDYCVPGTVVHVELGHLSHIQVHNAVLRDDSALLCWIATLAASYYGRPRASVTLRRRDVTQRPEVGTMITTVSSVHRSQQVNAVVTSVQATYDPAGQMGVAIQTSSDELDFV